MAYRTQSTRSQYRDVSPDKEDTSYARELTAAATAFLGSELISLGKRNSERKQINNALMLQSEAKKAELMTNIGALATQENAVNRAALEETSSAVVKDLADAQLRLNQSTGTYRYTDPLTGEERTRQDDLRTISQANNFVNNIGSDIEANEALIGKLQEQLAMNNIGDHPGAVDMSTVDPRVLAIALGDDPAKGIKFTETYKVDYDPEKGYMTSIVYKGDGIAEANKALGVSGDEFVINAKSLAGILNDPERNPANMYAYVSSNNFTGADNLFGKQATQITADGLLRDNFYTPAGEKTISLGGNRRQLVDQKMLKYNEVHSALNGTSVAAVGSSMRGNNPQQVLTDIKAYTKYDEKTKEYYYNTPKVGEDGLLQYNDKGEVIMNDDRSVLIKDGQLVVDQAELKDNLTEMYSQYQLGELGAYDKIRNIPIGNAYTIDKPDKDGGDDVDTSLFKILSKPVDDKPEEFMLGGEDKVLEVKSITRDGETFTGIGKDAEGLYVVSADNEKDRAEEKYNFYTNALIESADKNEKPSLLARFDELEKMTPSGSVNIKSVVDDIVNEAKTNKYQTEEGGALGFKGDDETEFKLYLEKEGFKSINEDDLRRVDFDDEEEMRTYITDKIFGNDYNKDVARKKAKRLAAGAESSSTGDQNKTNEDPNLEKIEW
jgi:hypothetical protein